MRLALLFVLAACGDLVDRDYSGDPLFILEGTTNETFDPPPTHGRLVWIPHSLFFNPRYVAPAPIDDACELPPLEDPVIESIPIFADAPVEVAFHFTSVSVPVTQMPPESALGPITIPFGINGTGGIGFILLYRDEDEDRAPDRATPERDGEIRAASRWSLNYFDGPENAFLPPGFSVGCGPIVEDVRTPLPIRGFDGATPLEQAVIATLTCEHLEIAYARETDPPACAQSIAPWSGGRFTWRRVEGNGQCRVLVREGIVCDGSAPSLCDPGC